MKKLLSLLGLVLLISLAWYYREALLFRYQVWMVDSQNAETLAEIQETLPTASGSVIIPTAPEILTEKVYLNVPFTSQAPLVNWDELHENACEEAALLQLHYYLQGQEFTPQLADQEILAMVDWEVKTFGDHHDIYAEELKRVAIEYLGYTPEQVYILNNVTIEDLKRELAAGHPVVAPITGSLLKNPYYRYPGYHMLTVIGYTPTHFITNDVGTRRGKDFSYEYERFMTALKDASGDVLVIEKEV